MKMILRGIILIFIAPHALAAQLEFVTDAIIEKSQVFKTEFGGISAAHYSQRENKLYLLSDDRGKLNEPRFYSVDIQFDKNLTVKPTEALFVRPSHIAHEPRPTGKFKNFEILDLEGMAPLPWFDFLIASEGDNNKKPRIPPRLSAVKPSGEYMRDFSIPDIFIPEATGKQKRGIQNNNGFEGLSSSPSMNRVVAAIESPLIHEVNVKQSRIRFVEYTMTRPFVIEPQKQYAYDLEKVKDGLFTGLTEILFVDENKLITMERSIQLSVPIQYRTQLFEVDLNGAQDVSNFKNIHSDDVKALKKTKIADLQDHVKSFKSHNRTENYEAMSWVQFPNSKERFLLIVSDNNFMQNTPTHFILFRYKE